MVTRASGGGEVRNGISAEFERVKTAGLWAAVGNGLLDGPLEWARPGLLYRTMGDAHRTGQQVGAVLDLGIISRGSGRGVG